MLLGLSLTACGPIAGGPTADTSVSAAVAASESPTPSPTPTPSAAAAPASASPVVPTLARPAIVGPDGAYLPAWNVSPGAFNPEVTQVTIASTICVSGFTATIRPSTTYTNALKAAELARGYAVNGDRDMAAYEEDHLIPLELGGSPTSVKNLWPEPWEHSASHPAGFAAVGTGAQTKDRIEDSLRSRVCAGAITLAAAQRLIATNWRIAFDTYIGAPVAKPTPAPTTQASPPPVTSPPVQGPPAGATALCNDGTYSHSQHRSGTCSHHGGVAIWY